MEDFIDSQDLRNIQGRLERLSRLGEEIRRRGGEAIA